MNKITDQRIRECQDATDQVIDQVTGAMARLGSWRSNGYGILTDPSETRSDLRLAKSAIDDALAILNGINWPDGKEYDTW